MKDDHGPPTRNVWSSAHRAAVRVGLVAVLLYAAIILLFAATNGRNAEWFVKFGEVGIITDFARTELGPDLVTPYDGHDGQHFWLLARDPTLSDSQLLNSHFDRPTYRAQRILYPALAAP